MNEPNDAVQEHRLCHEQGCSYCPTLKQIARYMTDLAAHNGERYLVKDMWHVSAARRHDRTATITIEETGETSTVKGCTYSEQYTLHFQLVNRGSYDRESYHVTVSSSYYQGQDRRPDDVHEHLQSVVRIDGHYVTTYLDAVRDLDTKERADLGSYQGIIAFAIIRPALEQRFLKVAR